MIWCTDGGYACDAGVSRDRLFAQFASGVESGKSMVDDRTARDGHEICSGRDAFDATP